MNLRYQFSRPSCLWCSKDFGYANNTVERAAIEAAIDQHQKQEHPAELAEYRRKLRES